MKTPEIPYDAHQWAAERCAMKRELQRRGIAPVTTRSDMYATTALWRQLIALGLTTDAVDSIMRQGRVANLIRRGLLDPEKGNL